MAVADTILLLSSGQATVADVQHHCPQYRLAKQIIHHSFEKEINVGLRESKLTLVRVVNLKWRDLNADICG